MRTRSPGFDLEARRHALLITRDIDNLAQQGRVHECRGVLAVFPVEHPGERVLASLYYWLSPAWSAPTEPLGGGGTSCSGTAWVSTHALYVRMSSGMAVWRWADLVAAEMVRPAQLSFAFRAAPDTRHVLVSDWAELVFTTWARAENPRHLQYRTGDWLPVHELRAGHDRTGAADCAGPALSAWLPALPVI